MTPRQLLMLAEEHRYATDPHATRPVAPREEPDDIGWAVALQAQLARQGGRPG